MVQFSPLGRREEGRHRWRSLSGLRHSSLVTLSVDLNLSNGDEERSFYRHRGLGPIREEHTGETTGSTSRPEHKSQIDEVSRQVNVSLYFV